MARRMQAILDGKFPYLVAEIDGAVAGYAYASLYRTRPAYRFTVEDSVYVAPDMHRRGIGKALLMKLIEACTALGFRQMIAVIGDSDQAASIGVHKACGFTDAGNLQQYRLEIRPLARHAADAAARSVRERRRRRRSVTSCPMARPPSANLH